MPRRHTDHDLAMILRRQGHDVPVPPKPRKGRRREESEIQCALIVWWSHACKGYGVPEHMLFSIPNGGWRDPAGAAILKREGQRNGVCDLFLAVRRGPWCGLFVEMKTPVGVVSDEQEAFIADASKQGYATHVCRSFDAAVKVIGDYLF